MVQTCGTLMCWNFGAVPVYGGHDIHLWMPACRFDNQYQEE